MIRYTISVVVFVGLASTFAASAAVRTPPAVVARSHAAWMARDANPKHQWLYATGYKNSIVTIYDLDRVGTPQVGQITDGVSGPVGVTIDNLGNVYVANKTAGDVTIYAAGQTTPALVLSTGLASPVYAVIDASGNVFVANRGTSPSIVVYPPGETSPSQTISDPLIQVPTELAFDSTGNLYFSDSSTGVSEITLGSNQPVSLGLKGVTSAAGLAISPTSGELFVSQAGSYKAGKKRVRVYAPGGVEPIRQLDDAGFADFLAVATVGHIDAVLVPSTVTNGVSVFKMQGRKAEAAFATNADYLESVAVKPAGIP